MHTPTQLPKGDKEAAEMNLLTIQWVSRGTIQSEFGKITLKEKVNIPQEKPNILLRC